MREQTYDAYSAAVRCHQERGRFCSPAAPTDPPAPEDFETPGRAHKSSRARPGRAEFSKLLASLIVLLYVGATPIWNVHSVPQEAQRLVGLPFVGGLIDCLIGTVYGVVPQLAVLLHALGLPLG